MKFLQSLSATQQIGLLFLILFGGLLLMSAVAVFVAMRDKSPQDDHGLTKFAADLRALWVGAVVFWLAWVSGAAGATILFAVFSFLALREFVTLMQTRRADHRSLILAFFVLRERLSALQTVGIVLALGASAVLALV